jgi:hypothetical protein
MCVTNETSAEWFLAAAAARRAADKQPKIKDLPQFCSKARQ